MSEVNGAAIKGYYRIEDPAGNSYRVLSGSEIQRRVNAHDRLTEALEDALETLEVVDPRHTTRHRLESLLQELEGGDG